MAKKDNEEKKFNQKRINGLFDFIKQGMNSIYADTYQNSNRNRTDISDIKNDIDSSISALTSIDDNNINNISIKVKAINTTIKSKSWLEVFHFNL